MKIFTAAQIKKWDACTIREQGITSLELMERAAKACTQWLLEQQVSQHPIHVFCGKGNNGGDGLAIARLLLENKASVTVYILESGKPGSDDFQANLQKLHTYTSEIHFIQPGLNFPPLHPGDIVIDALFGTGLHKPLADLGRELVDHLNNSGAGIVSIDIPSGLSADKSSKGNTCITASHTLSLQAYKAAFLYPENNRFIGNLHLLKIGLSEHFEQTEPSAFEMLDRSIIRSFTRHRSPFSHKGHFGHAALLAGSMGMMGAAVLASKACLRSGTGKLTVFIPACGYDILQTTVPEAMCRIAGDKHLDSLEIKDPFNAIGIGPGIGTEAETWTVLKKICSQKKIPLVLDADALNLLSMEKNRLGQIPPGSVITPHPKEFERLFGKTSGDAEQLKLAIQKAAALNTYIVLKGHHTAIITPLGKVYFNNTGNAGMAKGGMGDVLTGLVTGLVAQQYSLPEAAILGVYLHGLAGDIAAEKYSQESMQASDLLQCIGEAWKTIGHS